MRLLELEISKVRGIKNVKLSPQGKNLVIWGPNGSGKSAVVDAIDFLLTGRISRLIGEGTGGITLKAHGPHVDHKPKEAYVVGSILIPGWKGPVQIRRSMDSPTKLQCTTGTESALRPILDAASKGQYVLSRRQILRFVAAEAGKRASEVQALLNLGELEEIRRAFTRAENAAKSESSHADNAVRTAERAILLTLGLKTFDPNDILSEVNRQRAILHGKSIEKFAANRIKLNLAAPAASGQAQGLNPQLLRKDYGAIQEILSGAVEKIGKKEEALRRTLAEVKENKGGLEALKKFKLLELGVTLIDEMGSCPLCGTSWPKGELKRHIEEHIAEAQTAAEKTKTIGQLAGGLATEATAARAIVDRAAGAAIKLEMKDEGASLGHLSTALSALIQDLEQPLEKYPGVSYSVAEIPRLLISNSTVDMIRKVTEEAETKLPPATPDQTAWDILTRLEENLRQYEAAQRASESAARFYRSSQILASTFESSRDEVLSALFGEIEARFTELYRFIHSDDESKFESELRPQGPGLDLQVDFYGRGMFPPLAVHSEGHQDTMGVCLYLALAEKLNSGLIDLTILDDVVMSVDAGHRRQICRLITEKFPGRQFLITTHDKTWARELETTGVVNRKDSMEFSHWTIESGPVLNVEVDLWTRIENCIKDGDIPAAAHRLRRGGEQFFEYACDSLRASVVYRSDGRYELSDFSSGAIGAYRDYIRQAKAAAQTWGNTSDFEKLQELETVAKQVIVRSQIEQWAVNQNVHYSHWGEFQPEDFRPVFEAWRDLFGLFQCAECGSTLFISMNTDKKPMALRCKCGKVNWNLVRKSG